MAAVTRKVTISVCEDFYKPPLCKAGARKMGTLIDTHPNKKIVTKTSRKAP